MTEKESWYKNRILWKADKNSLFDYSCKRFEDLDERSQDCIKNFMLKDETPIVVFFENCNKWTAMSTQSLCSYHDETFHRIEKSSFTQKITPHIEKNDISLTHSRDKKDVKWLKMNETKEYIWFPSAEELWGFWSVIKMMERFK